MIFASERGVFTSGTMHFYEALRLSYSSISAVAEVANNPSFLHFKDRMDAFEKKYPLSGIILWVLWLLIAES
jgi:glutaredoxin-related protein